MDDVTFRPYRPGDEVAINGGFNRVFGLSRSLEEWRWKFAAGPEGRWIMLALDGQGRLLAHYGAVPVRLQVGDLTVRAGEPVDVFSVPEGRRGLAAARTFRLTVEAFFAQFGGPEKLAVLFGFPGDKHLRLGMATLGYDRMVPQPVTVFRRAPVPHRPRWTGHSVRVGVDLDAADRLWARAKRRYRVALTRDAAWVGRRFLGRPGVEYLHLVATRWGEPAALAVVRVADTSVHWAELVWDGRSGRALTALDTAVGELARSRGATSIDMWLGGDTAAEDWLAQHGWQRGQDPAGLMMVARSFHPAIDVGGFPGAFYSTMGDADLV